jgi:hypothetical protein
MSVIEITVQFREGETHTSQTIVLDGIRVRLDTYTNIDDDSWYLDVFDDQDQPIVKGIALAVGLDLWFPYRYKPLPPGILFVQDQSGQPFTDPKVVDFLAGNMTLYYVTADQVFVPIPSATVES